MDVESLKKVLVKASNSIILAEVDELNAVMHLLNKLAQDIKNAKKDVCSS